MNQALKERLMIVNNKTHFGFESVNKNIKAKKVKDVFESVATKYDLMNSLMSGGLHKIWKKYFTQILSLKNNSKILDLASGTGDVCIELSNQNKNFQIFHTDINIKMLEQGKIKLINHGLEFSKIWGPLSKIYDGFSFNILPKLGKIFAKDESSYQYLVESIRMHPDQKTLQSMMQNQGFDNTSFQNLSGGIVAIHQGYKF